MLSRSSRFSMASRYLRECILTTNNITNFVQKLVASLRSSTQNFDLVRLMAIGFTSFKITCSTKHRHKLKDISPLCPLIIPLSLTNSKYAWKFANLHGPKSPTVCCGSQSKQYLHIRDVTHLSGDGYGQHWKYNPN